MRPLNKWCASSTAQARFPKLTAVAPVTGYQHCCCPSVGFEEPYMSDLKVCCNVYNNVFYREMVPQLNKSYY